MDAPILLDHFSYDHPANPWFGGGGAQRDWEILRRLSPAWTPTYHAGGFPGCEPALPDGLRPPTRWMGRGGNRWTSRIAYVASCERRLRSERAWSGNRILSSSPSVFAPVPSLLRHPERVVLTVHHIVGRDAWKKYGPLGLVAMHHERQLLARGRYFICVNRATAARIQEGRPEARVWIVPNGVEDELLDVEERPLVEAPVIVSFGRLDLYMKGLDRLLAAFEIVARENRAARLVIAGRGGPQAVDDLRTRVAAHPFGGRVELRPNVPPEEKKDLLAGGRLFCAPSRFEGWCIAAVEAAASGLPVVASTADGFLDSVRDGETGHLLRNDDATIVPELGRSLLSLLGDFPACARLGAAGRRWAGRFRWDALAQEQERCYAEALAKASE